MLIPYSNSKLSFFNPFYDFDEIEKRFFGNSSLSHFKTDIRDNETEYVLEADLPGFKKEDIKIEINDDTLSIHAQRHSDFEKKDEQGNYIRCERSYGSYSRSFNTSGIDTDKISASYTDGVLKLTMPKMKELPKTSRRLEIS